MLFLANQKFYTVACVYKVHCHNNYNVTTVIVNQNFAMIFIIIVLGFFFVCWYKEDNVAFLLWLNGWDRVKVEGLHGQTLTLRKTNDTSLKIWGLYIFILYRLI